MDTHISPDTASVEDTSRQHGSLDSLKTSMCQMFGSEEAGTMDEYHTEADVLESD